MLCYSEPSCGMKSQPLINIFSGHRRTRCFPSRQWWSTHLSISCERSCSVTAVNRSLFEFPRSIPGFTVTGFEVTVSSLRLNTPEVMRINRPHILIQFHHDSMDSARVHYFSQMSVNETRLTAVIGACLALSNSCWWIEPCHIFINDRRCWSFITHSHLWVIDHHDLRSENFSC